MWFKQASIFHFSRKFSMTQQQLTDALLPLSFTPCLPSFPSSMGWVSPLGKSDSQLVYGTKRFWMICLQLEEKVLPAGVIRQALEEKIEEIEKKEGRIVRGKEKQSFKDEIIQTLLPKAFTKKSKLYAFIDMDRQWLIINSNNSTKIQRFTAFFKRAIAPVDLTPTDTKKPSAVMTHWLKSGDVPEGFTIGLSCMLQDPQQQQRMIRCQHQDLLSHSVQSFLNEGCDVMQVALFWRDQVRVVVSSDFTLRTVKFEEAVLSLSESDYTETPEQRFDADFVLMTEIMTGLIGDLIAAFSTHTAQIEAVAA